MEPLRNFAWVKTPCHVWVVISFTRRGWDSASQKPGNGLKSELRCPGRCTCSFNNWRPPLEMGPLELTLHSPGTYNRFAMQKRLIPAVVLTLSLCAASIRGQDPNPGSPSSPTNPPTSPQQTGAPQQLEAAPQVPGGRITQVVNLVDVLFTVLNRRNKLVPDLGKDDFKIFDDNKPQAIRYFSKQTDLPLRIGMLLDTSNSIRDRIKFEQDAATSFLFNVIRHGKDQAFVMTFDDEPNILQTFTEDTGRLRDEIVKTRAGGGTAVYDAIYDACFKELSHPPRPPGDQPDVVRRVMIVISDGEDNLFGGLARKPSRWPSAPVW